METQIATTIEQSKRLIKAGLDPKSADMCWRALAFEKGGDGNWYPQKGTPINLHAEKPMGLDVPAWSLSKLWDMLTGTILGGWFTLGGSQTSEYVIEELVRMLEQKGEYQE